MAPPSCPPPAGGGRSWPWRLRPPSPGGAAPQTPQALRGARSRPNPVWSLVLLAGIVAGLVGLAGASGGGAAAEAVASVRTGAAGPQAPVAQLFGSAQPNLGGRLLFVNDGNLWKWEQGSSAEIGVGNTWHQPRFSPNGERVAYVYRTFNFTEIFVMDGLGGAQTRLTRSQSRILDDNDWNFWPTWSPDGARIAYLSDAASYNPALWVMNADGTGRRAVATPGVLQDAVDSLSWSPDGSLLAMTVFTGPVPSQIALVPMAANARQQAALLTQEPGGALDPAWSPDGQWLAYAAREGRSVDIFAVRANGSGRVRLTNTGMARSPVWSPDGKYLAFLSAKTSQFEAYAVEVRAAGDSLEARNERQLTRDLGLDATAGLTWGR